MASSSEIERSSCAKRVLFICRVGTGRGGLQTQIISLLRRLDRTRYRPFVAVSQPGFLTKQLEALAIPHRVFRWYEIKDSLLPRVKSRLKSFLNLWLRRKHLRWAQELRPDIVHGDCTDLEILRFLAQKTGATVVCHVRSNAVFNLDLSGVNFVHRFVSISHRLKAPLEKAGIPEAKIEIINDGVDLLHFIPSGGEPSLGEGDRKAVPRVGIVGRLEPGKRILDCLRVAHRLKASDVDVKFVFVGNCFRRSYFKKILAERKRLNLETTCEFLPESESIRDFLHSIDVLLSLSGGSIMIEAMAMGKPVVAAAPPSPAGQSIVKHGLTGFLYEANDLEGVAAGLRTLLNDAGLRRDFGKAARAKAVETFDADRLHERMLQVYAQL